MQEYLMLDVCLLSGLRLKELARRAGELESVVRQEISRFRYLNRCAGYSVGSCAVINQA